MKPEILIATTNENKFREIASALNPKLFAIQSLKEFPEVIEAEESGSDFKEIARNKALYYWEKTGMTVMAEDSGLVIPCLGGFPGIYSARIAPDDASKIETILTKLKGSTDRNAYYICCMALVSGTGLYETEGRCDGRISDAPMGNGGFGYDPIFCPEGLDQTFGMMEAAEKMKYSHRGRAVRKMIPFLEMIRKEPEKK